ncbi:MAG: hypothetical protein ACXVY8_02325 [Gaiellaceae bacterium]
MTTLSHESPGLERRAAWLELDVVWVSLAIAVIWLAVLFDGVFGPDMTFMNGAGTTTTTIPSAVGVALFASIATSAIAKRCFGRGRTQ